MLSVWKEIFVDSERKKLVVNKQGNIVLVSSQLPVLFVTSWNVPTLRILKNQLVQLKQLGNEGKNIAVFGCKILSEFQQFRNPALQICALSCISQLIEDFLESSKKQKQKVQILNLLQIANNLLTLKLKNYLFEQEIQQLSILLSETVVKSLGCNLRFSLLSGEIKQSKLVKGILLDVDFPPKFVDRTFQNCKIALFDISLEKNADLISLTKFLLEHQINVVMSQKLIHPSMRRLLLLKDVLVIERISLRYIHLVQQVTQCKVISTQRASLIHPNMFGKANNITINSPKGLVTIIPSSDLFWTLIIFWKESILNEELISCIDECIYIMRQSITENEISPKQELSQYINAQLEKFPKSMQKYGNIFCEALKSLPTPLVSQQLRLKTLLFTIEMISNVAMLDHNSLLMEK